MAYSKEVLEHFNNPKNVGELDENDKNTGISIVGAPACGDVLKFSFKVDENGIIIEAKFLAFGCGSAIASSSYLTEQVIGKTVQEAKQITNKEISQALALPPIKYHCSVLAQEAVEKAAQNLQQKNK